MTPDQRQALEQFASHLPRNAHGTRVLYASASSAERVEESRTPQWFRAHGFEVEELDPTKDLRFLTLKRESYDGIWAGRALATFKIEESQRVIATFFQALKPRSGVLFTVHPFAELGFESMLRQNGFHVLLQGRRETEADSIAVIARRI